LEKLQISKGLMIILLDLMKLLQELWSTEIQ